MNTNESLKYGILGGLFIIPFIPFYVSSSMLFPFISGKNFLFRIIVLVISALWVALMLRDKEYRPKKSGILWSFVFFMVAMGIATVTAENSYKAFWSNFERMEGYIGLIHIFLYFLVLSSVIHVQKNWNALWGTWIASSVLMCVYGTTQVLGLKQINQGGVRVDGTLGNATYLAVFLMSLVFISGFLYLRARDKKKAMFILFPIALYQMIILYFTATRGAILGLIGGIFVAAILAAVGERENKYVRRAAIGVTAGVLLFIAGFVAMRNATFVKESPVLSRFASLSLSDIKTQGRFFIWPMALDGFRERPVTGWGQEGFNYVFNKNYNPAMYAQEQWFDRAHSAPLDWLVAGGILGFMGYLGLLLFAVRLIWKDVNGVWSFSEKSLLTGFLAAYFFQSLFVFDNLVSYLLFFTFLSMVHAMGSSERVHLPQFLEAQTLRSAISIAMIILATVLMYIWNIKPIIAGQNLISSLRIMSTEGGSAEESLSHFEKIFESNTFARSESREQFASAAPYFLGENTSTEVKNRYGTLALEQMEAQLLETPNDARSHLVWAGFLRSIGRFDEALKKYERALELSPKKQVTMFEIGSLYLDQGNPTEALVWFKKAFDLDPRYPEARFLYGTAALYGGNKTLSDELLSTIPESQLYNEDRFVNVLLRLKRYDDLVKIFNRRIADGADTLDNTVSLAAIYLESGNRGQAVNVLRRYVNNHPESREQIEYYITEIEAGRNP